MPGKQTKKAPPSPARTEATTPPSSPASLTIRTEASPRSFLAPAQKPICCLAIFLIVALITAGGLWGWLFEIPGLQTQIKELEGQVDRLETQVDRLAGQNDRFALLNTELNGTVSVLKDVNLELQNTTEFLETVVVNLNGTAGFLSQVNTNLTEENERFADLNEGLLSIVTFLNDTVGVLDLEDLVDNISEQINLQRLLLMRSLESTFRNLLLSWDCAFRDVFRNEPFVADEATPIENQRKAAVLDYVDEKVLAPLCLDREDFERYLESTYASLAPNDLYQGVAVYAQAASLYYFGGDNVSSQDWAEAKFSCKNLPVFSF